MWVKKKEWKKKKKKERVNEPEGKTDLYFEDETNQFMVTIKFEYGTHSHHKNSKNSKTQKNYSLEDFKKSIKK